MIKCLIGAGIILISGGIGMHFNVKEGERNPHASLYWFLGIISGIFATWVVLS